ncbi:CDT1-like protein a, chloroplastic [Aristolochia californica]|uniref:CDT1-like protein a, chloroplastic n=1 Tax=Aristolochia californica TaxID=171875 RepID=UPI0035E0C6F3
MKPTSSSFAASESPKSAVRRKILSSDMSDLTSRTPQKPEVAPRRVRNRRVAFSLTEVREIAKGLQRSSKEVDNDSKDMESFTAVAAERPKRAKADCELPEKYQILAKFFDSLESSIRLLQLKQTTSTFSNVSRSIESLTERRFTYGHLAQIKYILQEELDVKKILVRDEKTLCMKPELHIKLQIDPLGKVKKDKSNGYLHLRKEFRARLLNFYRAHPKGDEIPEENLPDPFNPTTPCMLPNMEKPVQSRSWSPLPEVPPPEPTLIASHLPQTFQRRFLQKSSNQLSEKPQLDGLTTPIKPAEPINPQSCSSVVHSPISQITCKPSKNKKSLEFGETVTEPKTDGEDYLKENVPVKGTPPRLISTPIRLMTHTPEVQPAKRCRLSLEDSPVQMTRQQSRPRSLNFLSPAKNTSADGEKEEKGLSSADGNSLKFLPETLLQSIRKKERKAKEERDLGCAESRKRKQMIAQLPKLIDMIHLIFQSAKKCVITKCELIHKIILHHVDIIDREEIQELLKLLEEVVPDWISEKTISTGDPVYRINNGLGPEAIHARLAEAE